MILGASCPWKVSEMEHTVAAGGMRCISRLQPLYFLSPLITADSFGRGNHPRYQGRTTHAKSPSFDTHDLWAPAKMMIAVVKIEARSQKSCETVRNWVHIASSFTVYSNVLSGLVFSTLQVHRTHFRCQSAWRLSQALASITVRIMPYHIATIV